MTKLFFVLLAVSTMGCAAGHCRSEKAPDQVAPRREADGVRLKETFNTEAKKPDMTNVKVYKADGTTQCNKGKFIPLEKMAQQLQGIDILQQYSGNDGMVHAMSCGMPTGKVHIFVINQMDLKKAIDLGFALLP